MPVQIVVLERDAVHVRITPILLTSALILGTLACGGISSPQETTHTVTMMISGTIPVADVTYGVGVHQSQENSVKLPWEKTLTVSRYPIGVVAMAQSRSREEGTQILCKLTIDDHEPIRNTSTGPFAIVTCSA